MLSSELWQTSSYKWSKASQYAPGTCSVWLEYLENTINYAEWKYKMVAVWHWVLGVGDKRNIHSEN